MKYSKQRYLCLSHFVYFVGFFSPYMQVTTIENPYPIKEEEENAMHNTVVIFSSNDSFTLKQVCFFFMFTHKCSDMVHFEFQTFNVQKFMGCNSVCA